MADVWGSGVTETQTGSSTWQMSGGQGSLKQTGSSTWQTSGGQGSLKQTGSSTWQMFGGQGSLEHRQEVVHGRCLGVRCH